jgi:hypothetical protein
MADFVFARFQMAMSPASTSWSRQHDCVSVPKHFSKNA